MIHQSQLLHVQQSYHLQNLKKKILHCSEMEYVSHVFEKKNHPEKQYKLRKPNSVMLIKERKYSSLYNELISRYNKIASRINELVT